MEHYITAPKTKLQREFAKSNIARQAMADLLIDEGVPISAGNPFLWKITAGIIATMPEPKIKMLLYNILTDDPTEAERAEALKLLALSETALTTTQMQELHKI